MGKVSRTEVIRHLKDERIEAVKHLDEIDAALLAFGVTPPTRKVSKRRPSADVSKMDADVVDELCQMGSWVNTAELCDLMGIPLNGTIYGSLNRLADEGRIERQKLEGRRYQWRCKNPEKDEATS